MFPVTDTRWPLSDVSRLYSSPVITSCTRAAAVVSVLLNSEGQSVTGSSSVRIQYVSGLSPFATLSYFGGPGNVSLTNVPLTVTSESSFTQSAWAAYDESPSTTVRSAVRSI